MFLIFREEFQPVQGSIPLEAFEYRHARARRLGPEDPVFVGDGSSRRYEGRLTASGDAFTLIHDVPVEEREEPDVQLFTALPEGKRWDWLLQKAVELGATRIVPVLFERSVRKNQKVGDRERRIILEAAVQSRRFRLPSLGDEIELNRVLAQENSLFLCALHPPPEAVLPFTGESKSGILIGPEGGLSHTELDLIRSAGVELAYLGRNILRIETAALAGLSVFAARFRI